AAARAALGRAGVAAEKITHVITACCTGFVAPGFDLRLIKSLKLSPGVARTHVGFMGCHGALNALRVAAAFAAADPAARILICATELCSLHYRYGRGSDKLVANAIFADGAAAMVCSSVETRRSRERSNSGHPSHLVGEGPGVRGRALGSSSPSPPFDKLMTGRPSPMKGERAPPDNRWHLIANGSHLFPSSEDAMAWRIGDHGFEMSLSPKVPELIAAHLRPWLESWLAECGLTLADVATWAVHPGGPRIVGQVAAGLGLSDEATAVSQQVLKECGNMSSSTIVFILERLIAQGAPRPCVALAFGPGLVVEAALFR
ncbi:MAG TPA: 3-oxoacyl-[acyl-carrier-protein] synthase III C-terminal domain-containing protein, partial [Pirellulales bacterium]|nr:3-oxoacyl-[acyl-carrier-protein] synthase III C-terminal domain-containing protein [Pirellulales bacterium]